MKKLILAAMALTLATSAFAGKPVRTETAAVENIIVDVDARTDGFFNPVNVYLEAGSYQVTPIGVEEGGKFVSRNAWNGRSWRCDSDGTNCSQGWEMRITAEAYELGLVTNKYSTAFQSDVLYCDNELFIEQGKRMPVQSKEMALAYGKMGIKNCVVTIETSGFVRFFDHDRIQRDNYGGVSFTLTRIDAEPECVKPGNGKGKAHGVCGTNENNGWGNGDQDAPGNSLDNNHAENYTGE